MSAPNRQSVTRAHTIGENAMLNQMTSSNALSAPTIVLVHGAFADSSSWNGVIARLLLTGTPLSRREPAARPEG